MLPPLLLLLSMRLHLSLYLSLPTLGTGRFEDRSIQVRLIRAIKQVLESACLMVGDGGHSPGWKSVVLGMLVGHTGQVCCSS
jgi:hypothetical protein